MVLLSTARRKGDETAEAQWRVPQEGPFIENGRLARPAMIEIAAQTAAAAVGIDRLIRGEPVTVGLLGAVAAMTIIGDAHSGDLLRCDVTFVLRYERLARVSFQLVRMEADPAAPTPIAAGQLTLALSG